MWKIIGAMLILLVSFTTTVSAHTGITNSTPADGEVVTAEVHEIVLEFNTNIESTSTVKVLNENGEEIIVSNIQVNDNLMTVAFISPLDNGTFSVDWKIIGGDGHPIQGNYSFSVSQEDAVDSTIVEEGPPESPTDPIEETKDNPVEQQIEDTSKLASNDVLVVFLVVLFSIAGGFFGWVVGRRQK